MFSLLIWLQGSTPQLSVTGAWLWDQDLLRHATRQLCAHMYDQLCQQLLRTSLQEVSSVDLGQDTEQHPLGTASAQSGIIADLQLCSTVALPCEMPRPSYVVTPSAQSPTRFLAHCFA